MLDNIKNIFNTILNKEGRGELTPLEFDGLVEVAQMNIFNSYLEEYKKAIRQNNRGLGSLGLADAKLNASSKIKPFRVFSRKIIITKGYSSQPKDIIHIDSVSVNDIPVSIIDHGLTRVMMSSKTKPTKEFPVCVFDNGFIVFKPEFENEVAYISGIRFPKKPKWTYREVGNSTLFNPSASDFQDIELSESELPEIIWNLCSLAGVRLKDLEIYQIMEKYKYTDFQKENM